MSTLLIEVNGVEYRNFKSASVTTQIDAVAGTFEFEAVSTQARPLPIRQGDKCKIVVDGEAVLTGYIETLDVDYDSSSHGITLSGRSKTADIIDSSINALEIKPPISLKSTIQKVISHIGIRDINVIDAAGNLERFNKAEDLLSPEVGQNAFEFIEKLARKRQVLLTTNGDGDIVIVKPGADTAPVAIQNTFDGDQNNIETASVSYDNTERFGKYVVASQLNMTTMSLSGDANTKAMTNQKSTAVIDNEIRSSRQMVIQAESSSSEKQVLDRAKWEANIRKTRGVVYSTTLPDFSIDGKLWKTNQLTAIRDEFAGIEAVMMVNSVNFTLDKSGASTNLSFVDRNAYTLLLNEPEKGNKKGVGLT